MKGAFELSEPILFLSFFTTFVRTKEACCSEEGVVLKHVIGLVLDLAAAS